MVAESAFVQVTEVWVPDGDVLRLDSAAYGRHQLFAAASEGQVFRAGEGLPGSVWRSGIPEVWTDLDGRFLRAHAAAASGLDAAVGIPVYVQDEIAAVVTLLCGSREQLGGCIEVWQVKPDTDELGLAAGYYGRLREFARLSPLLRFQRGLGLPGITWERGIPQIVDDIRYSSTFLRAAVARESGVKAGLGIPIYRGGEITHVVLLMSAQSTPLARAFEVWSPNSDRLELTASTYGNGLEVFIEKPHTSLGAGEGLPGQAFLSAKPVIFNDLSDMQSPRNRMAAKCGLEVGIAIPIHDGAQTLAVVVLLS